MFVSSAYTSIDNCSVANWKDRTHHMGNQNLATQILPLSYLISKTYFGKSPIRWSPNVLHNDRILLLEYSRPPAFTRSVTITVLSIKTAV